MRRATSVFDMEVKIEKKNVLENFLLWYGLKISLVITRCTGRCSMDILYDENSSGLNILQNYASKSKFPKMSFKNVIFLYKFNDIFYRYALTK